MTEQGIVLPKDLSGVDLVRLGEMVDDVKKNHDGNGFIGLWCPEPRLAFMAVCASGQIINWMLTPAPNEETAKVLMFIQAKLIGMIANETAAAAEKIADEAIAKATRH